MSRRHLFLRRYRRGNPPWPCTTFLRPDETFGESRRETVLHLRLVTTRWLLDPRNVESRGQRKFVVAHSFPLPRSSTGSFSPTPADPKEEYDLRSHRAVWLLPAPMTVGLGLDADPQTPRGFLGVMRLQLRVLRSWKCRRQCDHHRD